jgi:hypothetical protein
LDAAINTFCCNKCCEAAAEYTAAVTEEAKEATPFNKGT